MQLNAIALKNSLDINSIRALIRRGFDYEDAIERVVFANVFAKNLGSKFNILWNIYHNEFLNNIDNLEEKYIKLLESVTNVD